MNETITTSVPALDKTVRIFSYLFKTPGATFTQIQQDLGLPKSSTSSLLNALVEHHVLRQDRGRYFLGLRLYEWGTRSLEQFDISKVARPVLEKLRDSTALICHLGILDDVAPIYILKLESSQPIAIRTWVGKKLSLHSSGVGKALCAWLPQEAIDTLLPDEILPRYTDTTITSKTDLMKEFARIREQGWAFDNAEDSPGIYCIAAPVFNRSQEVVAAISISGVEVQLPKERIQDYSVLVRQACQELSLKLR
ncbi:IclR family transcriptional regulator [Salmonella enterica subsp. enterica]|nr:IclR family transcriptional regulator [Salmonella enterica subsp. enterica serovar Adjame]ECI4151960.1 IclR family transcriptional regulator [Salmonella enterica subsp. salamae]ECJ2943105.1 IclR family transcriptional regulator [Salmonella enterica subsp. enterica serovar Adjame]ECJ3639381.1 IclR family transcriptional regulator [Salmonella enterica subsp. enterica serovar Adjame]ECJ8732018.1 IclR family transcriptional regulator [Salmonella enterica subsp. enterica serovar Adjame]